jgi:DNA helicase-2/ATP-dependent DNA helicase PcrA
VLERTVLAAAFSWIRIALQPDEIRAADLMRVVRRPSRGLTRVTSQLIGYRRTLSSDDLYALGNSLTGKQADRWDGFCADIERVAVVAGKGDSVALLDVINREIGLSGAAQALDAGRRRADRAAQSDDLTALRRAAVLHRNLPDFEQWLRDVLQHPQAEDGVELSTVHRVKGMEWDRVIVFGADRGLLPHELAQDEEEERRVFHVAITRGRRQVVVLADRSHPSPFLAELTGEAKRQVAAVPAARTAGHGGISAAIGDRIRIAGGYSGVVDGFEDDGVAVALDSGSSILLVEWGEMVTTPGGSGPLLRPQDTGAVDGDLVDALKSWRLETAVANSVPAYVVLNDKTLHAIAAGRPRNERELIMIPGIGPAKLDAYGDDILAICAEENG